MSYTWGMKLVSFEPSGNEDSEYVFNIFLACLWTKRQHKTSGNTIFQSLVGKEGHCGTNWPAEVVEIAALYEFDKIIDSALTPVTYIRIIHFFRPFLHFSYKMDIKDGFLEKCLK
jgi:hypothetical protein